MWQAVPPILGARHAHRRTMPINPLRLFQGASDSLFGAPARPAASVVRPTQQGFVPRPPGMTAKEYEAYQLYALGEAGVTHVRLRAPEVEALPRVCAEHDGTVMSLDEAMRRQPIPHAAPRGQECLCSYRPAALI